MLNRIYIAMVDEDDDFDPAVHNRYDYQAVDYTLSKDAEKSFWMMKVDIVNPGGGLFRPGQKRRMHMAEDVNGVVTHLFTGRVEGWPLGPVGRVVSLTVMGKPATIKNDAGVIISSAETVEIAALAGVNDDPWNLFSEPGAKRTSDVVLAARPEVLHWSRDDTPPVLVDILEGDELIDIGEGYIEGTLEFDDPPDTPIAEVDGTVSAQWVQCVLASRNLSVEFSTISSPDWSRFPRAGETVGDWHVLSSEVDQTGSSFSDYFDGAATKNKSLDATETGNSIPMRFKRLDFDASATLVSVLSANRKETVTFKLFWAGQDISGYSGETGEVNLECGNLHNDAVVPPFQSGRPYGALDLVKAEGIMWRARFDVPGAASIYDNLDSWEPLLIDNTPLGGVAVNYFFGQPSVITDGGDTYITRTPPPGLSAVRFAMGQAKAMLIKGVRVIKASFEVPWEDVRTITGRERIRIADPEIPGGEMTGKVVSVSASLISGRCKITIASAPGTGPVTPLVMLPVYEYWILGTPGVIRNQVINGYHAQETALAAYEYPSEYDLNQVVENQLKTRFLFEMAPTSGTAEYSTVINLGNFNYNCDAMIDLEAEA